MTIPPARNQPACEGGGVVIAVDGPSGSGKSGTARAVARALGLRYLDTGAMYRALTWWLLRHGVSTDDPAAVAARAAEPVIEVGADPDALTITVDGVDVRESIRTRELSNAVSTVARVPQVRARLIALQRQIIARACAEAGGIVVDGRDIGTVVAPDATVKIFLTATEAARARRRSADLAADPAATVEVTQRELARRDRLDAPQTERAADAVEIDSTRLSLKEVVSDVVDLVKERVRTA